MLVGCWLLFPRSFIHSFTPTSILRFGLSLLIVTARVSTGRILIASHARTCSLQMSSAMVSFQKDIDKRTAHAREHAPCEHQEDSEHELTGSGMVARSLFELVKHLAEQRAVVGAITGCEQLCYKG